MSATPKRHGDEEGTQALIDYFGEPVISIGIKEAIYKYGALVEYDYLPHRIDLSLTSWSSTEPSRLGLPERSVATTTPPRASSGYEHG